MISKCRGPDSGIPKCPRPQFRNSEIPETPIPGFRNPGFEMPGPVTGRFRNPRGPLSPKSEILGIALRVRVSGAIQLNCVRFALTNFIWKVKSPLSISKSSLRRCKSRKRLIHRRCVEFRILQGHSVFAISKFQMPDVLPRTDHPGKQLLANEFANS